MNRERLHNHLVEMHTMPPDDDVELSLTTFRLMHGDQHWPRKGLPRLAWRPWLRILAVARDAWQECLSDLWLSRQQRRASRRR